MEVIEYDTTVFVPTSNPTEDNSIFSIIPAAVRIVAILISVFGVLGNMLTFMTAPKMGKNSGTGFIRCLSAADTCVLFCLGFFYSVVPLFGLDKLSVGENECKLIVMVISVFIGTGNISDLTIACFLEQLLA